MLKQYEYARIGERVWRDTLSNGLRLTVVPRPDHKKSKAFLAVRFGGADRRFRASAEWSETPAGVAHFLEHKMFDMEGGENALTILSERGANANAFTSTDLTAYYFESTDMFFENLELLLRFVSTPYFTEEGINKERSIIAQEIRMVEDDPDEALYYGLLQNLFAKNPIREQVAGSVESIQHITADTLNVCHKAFYTPSNMALVVVGNQDPERIRELAYEILPEDETLPCERDYGGDEGIKPLKARGSINRAVAAPLFMAGVKTQTKLRGRAGAKYELTASLALSTLMGKATPLFNQLYSKGVVNDTFFYDFEDSADVSYLTFGGESKAPEQVCLAVLDAAAELSAHGVNGDFFERRRKTAYGRVIRALNSFDNICYNSAVADFSGYDYFDTLPLLESVTEEDVREFIAQYMRPELLSVSVVENLD